MLFWRICPELNLPLSSLIFSQLAIQSILPSTYVFLKSTSSSQALLLLLQFQVYEILSLGLLRSFLPGLLASNFALTYKQFSKKTRQDNIFLKTTQMISLPCLKASKGISWHLKWNLLFILFYKPTYSGHANFPANFPFCWSLLSLHDWFVFPMSN